MKVKRAVLPILFFLSPVILLLVGWEIVAWLEIINPALISRPSEIFRLLYELATPTPRFLGHSIFLDIYISLYRLSCAFIIATVSGIGLGMLIGRNKYVYRFFDPLITVAMPVPGIAWAPIFMLWLGFGDPTIITVGALAAFFPIVYNTAAGVRSVDEKLIWSARSMGADEKTIFLKVFLPWSAAYILTGFKLALARGWRTIIAVEMIAASLLGLGFMIFDARDWLRPSIIYVGIIVLAITYFLIENVIKWIERRTIEKWGMVRST
jgi:ABC-type nitrate/sulfonate/bicarbonate transport system permease component